MLNPKFNYKRKILNNNNNYNYNNSNSNKTCNNRYNQWNLEKLIAFLL